MEKRISATRAVRDFSEVLNTIKFKGVHYIIERGGKAVASMKPIDEKADYKTLGELKGLLKKLPRLDEELDAFAADLEDILDTSVLIEAERQKAEIDKLTENREEEIFGISVITVAELLHGLHRADSTKRRLKRSAYVEKIIELFPIYAFETSIARIYAELWSDLSKKGIQIGAHDLIIGSTALSLGFSVATRNMRHFERLEGLKIEILTLQE